MGRGVKLPWVGGQNTMGKWVFIPWIEVKIPWKGVDIPWVGRSKYHG